MLKLSNFHMNKQYMSNGMLYLPELYDNHDRLIVSKTDRDIVFNVFFPFIQSW
jgi:hypothetical protein